MLRLCPPPIKLFCSLVFCMVGALPLSAQSLSFTGAQTTVPGSGLPDPFGVAVDGAGNVFISNAQGTVVKVTPAGVQTTMPISGMSPFGLAVDKAGDLFIADKNNNRVVEVTPAGVQTTVPAKGLNQPRGVAVDGAGDVFIADTNNSRVVEVTPAGVQTTVPARGLNQPYGVAVDAAGDVFIADTYNDRVVKVTSAGIQTTVPASGLGFLVGVAADAAGDVFITDTDNNRIVKVTPGGVQATLPTGGLRGPAGLAVDAAGNLFIADGVNSRVVEMQFDAVNVSAINVCPSRQTTPSPCNETVALNYQVNDAVTVNSVTALTTGLDFTIGATTCAGSLSSGTACTTNVTFAPPAPGARSGAVQLSDTSGKVLASTMVHGLGKAPAIAFGPGVQSTVPATLNGPSGMAVDGAGNLFIADTLNDRILKATPAGVHSIVPATGLYNPSGVAVDGAGNVFIADFFNNRVVEVTPAGVQTTFATGLNNPNDVAVDGAGDVFIADTGNGRVLKATPGGVVTTVPATGLVFPYSVASDGVGSVFIADPKNGRTVGVTPGGPQSTVPAIGIGYPFSVAVDAAGDLFIVDHWDFSVVEVTPTGFQTTLPAAGLRYPSGVAVNASGDVFISDTQHNRIVEINRSTPPALTFASTQVSSQSSPQSVIVQNIGNEPLTGAYSMGPDFMQVPGSGVPADCTKNFTMAPGASCTVSVVFSPKSPGVLTDSLTFTDNALNGAAVSQTVTLNGTGNAALALSANPTSLTFSPTLVGTYNPTAQTVTVTNTSTAGVNIQATDINTAEFLQTNNCGTLAPGGTCTATVKFRPTGAGQRNANLSFKWVNEYDAVVFLQVPLGGTGEANAAPTATSVTPNSGTAASPQSFAFTYTGATYFGNSDFKTLYFLFSTNGTSPGSGCYGYYTVATKTLDLYNDAATGTSSMVLGSAKTLSNSQCSISGATSSYSAPAGTQTGTLQLGITFSQTYPGTPTIYGRGQSNEGMVSDFTNLGSINIGTGANPSSLTFGSTLVGTYNPVAQTVTFTNPGTTGLNVLAVTVNTAEFSQTNNCGAVAPGGNCKITVRFRPVGTGARSAILSIKWANAVNPSIFLKVALSGTGEAATAPTATSVMPNGGTTASPQAFAFTYTGATSLGNSDFKALYFLFSKNGTSPGNGCYGYYTVADNTLSLYNNNASETSSMLLGAAETVSNSQCSISGAVSSYSATAGAQTGTLTLSITFSESYPGTPTIYGRAQSNQNLMSGFANLGAITIAISGISVNPTSLTFGATLVGTYNPSAQTLTVTNTGAAGLNILAITINTAEFLQTNDCGEIAPTGSCTVNVKFRPTGTGQRSAALSIKLANGASSSFFQQIPLSGTGEATATPTATSVTPNSGLATSPQPFAFTYTGTTSLGNADFKTLYFLFSKNSTNPGNGCYGYYTVATNTLYLYNNTATGTSSMSLGSAVTLSNSQCSISGATSSYSATPGTPTGTLTLGITFAETYPGMPTVYGRAQSNEGTVSEFANLGSIDIGLGANPASLTFGPALVGIYNPVAQTVTVTNPGTTELNILAIAINTAEFSQTNDCGDIAPGGTCTITVRFRPTGAGTRNANLSVKWANATSTNIFLTIPLSGTGDATTAPTATSVTPNSGTATTPQAFAFTYTGGTYLGNADFKRLYFLFSKNGTSPGNGCYGYYTVATNTLYLYNNASTETSSMLLGLAGTLSNSQCSISGSASSYSAAAGAQTGILTLGITLSGTYLGTPTIYGRAQSNQNVMSGFANLGAINIGISVNPASLTFGTEWVGDIDYYNPQTVTVTNPGTSEFSILAVYIDTMDFLETNNCGNLEPGNSCTITVYFRPAGPGQRSANLSVKWANASNTNIFTFVPLSGTGVAWN